MPELFLFKPGSVLYSGKKADPPAITDPFRRLKDQLHLLIHTALLFSSPVLYAQELTLITTSGTETTDSLTWLNYISFPENQLYISYRDGSEANYSLADISVIRFNSGKYLSVSETAGAGSSRIIPNPSSGEFSITNLPEGNNQFFIYRIDGSLVLEGFVSPSQPAISVENLEPGIYLVRTGTRSLKLIRQ
ncbi:MAG: T9SS type A sorting domain-containing protein [Bacteroidota bacterium]